VNEEVLSAETDQQAPKTDSWEALLANMRNRYPGASDGILFCILKLQQDPDLKLRDFRQEADLHGIKLGGRALHSAKVLLGLREPAVRRRRAEPEATDLVADQVGPELSLERNRRSPRRSRNGSDPAAAFAQMLDEVRAMHDAVLQENARLRQAMSVALSLLDEVLAED
jgi:hypothetical protein